MEAYKRLAEATIEDCMNNIRRLLRRRASGAKFTPQMAEELHDEVLWLSDPNNVMTCYLLPDDMTGRDVVDIICKQELN